MPERHFFASKRFLLFRLEILSRDLFYALQGSFDFIYFTFAEEPTKQF